MKGSAPRILVVGYNAFDVTIPVSGPPLSDTKVEVPEMRRAVGPRATAAVALAARDARVRLVTPLADDLPGRMQADELTAAGSIFAIARGSKATSRPRPSFWSISAANTGRSSGHGVTCPCSILKWPTQPGSIRTDLFDIDGHEGPISLSWRPTPAVENAGCDGTRVRFGPAPGNWRPCAPTWFRRRFSPRDSTEIEDPVAALMALAALVRMRWP